VLGRFLLAFGFRCELTQMFHHGVWIDLADGAELFLGLILILTFVLVFGFALIFVFAFAKQTAGDVAESAEPAFAFQSGLVLHLFFQFTFHLVLELSFEFVFEFQFTFELICHDESSCEKWSNLAGSCV
jgi:hypothetical protein